MSVATLCVVALYQFFIDCACPTPKMEICRTSSPKSSFFPRTASILP